MFSWLKGQVISDLGENKITKTQKDKTETCKFPDRWNSLGQGSSTPVPQTGTGPWPAKNRAAHQEVSSG